MSAHPGRDDLVRRGAPDDGAGGAESTTSPGSTASDQDREADARLVRLATGAQRQRLAALRANGTIGENAFQRVEGELDWIELSWVQVLRPEGDGGGFRRRP